MKEYLEEREKEVSDIMMILFDEETIRRNHEASVAREYHRSKDAAVEIVQKYWKENQ